MSGNFSLKGIRDKKYSHQAGQYLKTESVNLNNQIEIWKEKRMGKKIRREHPRSMAYYQMV